MNKMANIFNKIISNPPVIYVLTRYGTYILQFVNSIFIAILLGPYYLGIWGFINLVLGYINQLNLGIPYSMTVIISVEKDKDEYVQKVINNSFSMITFLCIFFIIILTINLLYGFDFGDKYNFESYIIPVSLIAVISHFNSLLSNIFRVFGDIFAISVNQSLFTILTILILPFFKGEDLLLSMVIMNTLSVIISLFIFIYKSPVKLKLSFDFKLIKYIQRRGLHLFIYNSSFALILITSKTFISDNYSVDQFGYFTFSFSLANAILLLLNSISYLITPKITNRFANSDLNHIREIIQKVRISFISLSHFLIHFVIMLFPIFLFLFPQYSSVDDIFKVTALTVVLTANSFGYNNLLLARGNENKMSLIALVSLFINIILVAWFILIIKIRFSFVMFPTMIAYFIFTYLSAYRGRKVLLLPTSIKTIIKDIFPWRMAFPFIVSLILILFSVPNIYYTIPFAVYLFLNFNDLKEIKHLGTKLISNPNFINI